MPDDYRLEVRPPTYDECMRLFLAVNWHDYITDNFAEVQLTNYLYYVVMIYQEAETIGMGRIRRFKGVYYLENIAVLPEHQGQGLGRRIMEHLLAYLAQIDDPDTRAFLIAAEGSQGFYEKLGFKYFAGSSTYMHFYLHKPTPDDEF